MLRGILLPELLEVLLQYCHNIARTMFWQYCPNIAGSSGSIARKGYFWQYCKKLICIRNPVLRQYCRNTLEWVSAVLQQYCCNILPETLYFGKGGP